MRKLQEELAILEIDEDNEIRKILYTLTVLVDEHINELRVNKDCMETLDFIFEILFVRMTPKVANILPTVN